MADVAIKISGLKKQYKLGQINSGTLQNDLQSLWARLRDKDDPNTKIGSKRGDGQVFMALNGVDLTVYKGETLGIIGRNGAGKSTLLKLISRITAPSEGKIGINGRVSSMLEVGTGFDSEMTGRENIYMNGAILGMSRAEVDAKMEDIIEFSEIREFIDTPAKRYSSGMYVKLAFSVIAHLDSDIMILDEVLAVGDMAFQKKCIDRMYNAAKNDGRTVLYVSHNMDTITRLCSRCIVIDEGKIIFDGAAKDAVEVYLAKNRNRLESADLKTARRPERLFGTEDFRFSSCEYIVAPEGELRMRIEWDTKSLNDEIFFTVVFGANGAGAAHAVASKPVLSGAKSAVLSADTSQLIDGSYDVRLVAAQNIGGAQKELDYVAIPAYDKISEKPGEASGLGRARGYVKLRGLEVVD